MRRRPSRLRTSRRVSPSWNEPRSYPNRANRKQGGRMRPQILRRVQALERRLPDQTIPTRATLPFWLLEELRPQGLRYDSDGRIDWESLRAITRCQTTGCAGATPRGAIG